MKLIFKIFKKVRELKKSEKKIKQNIKIVYKDIENAKLQEQEILESNNQLRRTLYVDMPLDLKRKQQLIEEEQAELRESWNNLRSKERRLNEREKELNSLQVKLNDQILKLGIFKGVNNE
ncbi:MAG: hypothetical protein EBV86_08545 [Marivivens sp.]|nr:hypothetical protein [Marivivens sp.]